MSYLLLLCLPLGWGWGCTACGGGCEDKPFTEQVRSYFLGFKPGSYWIYRNTQNGDIDSVYFVSENIYQQGGNVVDCRKEDAVVILRGFADSKQWGYYVTSWDNIMEPTTSEINFAGSHDFAKTESTTIGGSTYNQTVSMTHCCITGGARCYVPSCTPNYFRLIRLVFAPNIGLIRWEAENYPQSGQVVYELVRYQALR